MNTEDFIIISKKPETNDYILDDFMWLNKCTLQSDESGNKLIIFEVYEKC